MQHCSHFGSGTSSVRFAFQTRTQRRLCFAKAHAESASLARTCRTCHLPPTEQRESPDTRIFLPELLTGTRVWSLSLRANLPKTLPAAHNLGTLEEPAGNLPTACPDPSLPPPPRMQNSQEPVSQSFVSIQQTWPFLKGVASSSIGSKIMRPIVRPAGCETGRRPRLNSQMQGFQRLLLNYSFSNWPDTTALNNHSYIILIPWISGYQNVHGQQPRSKRSLVMS